MSRESKVSFSLTKLSPIWICANFTGWTLSFRPKSLIQTFCLITFPRQIIAVSIVSKTGNPWRSTYVVRFKWNFKRSEQSSNFITKSWTFPMAFSRSFISVKLKTSPFILCPKPIKYKKQFLWLTLGVDKLFTRIWLQHNNQISFSPRHVSHLQHGNNISCHLAQHKKQNLGCLFGIVFFLNHLLDEENVRLKLSYVF